MPNAAVHKSPIARHTPSSAARAHQWHERGLVDVISAHCSQTLYSKHSDPWGVGAGVGDGVGSLKFKKTIF